MKNDIASWATKDKYRTGEDLKIELLISMEKVLRNEIFIAWKQQISNWSLDDEAQ